MDIEDVLFFRVPFREVRTNNLGTRVFLFDKFVLKWVSQTHDDFLDVVSLINYVYKKGFPTAKLVYSDYVKGKGIYIFEKVEGRVFGFDDDFSELGRYVNFFYRVTKDFNFGKGRPKLNLRIGDGLVRDIYNFLLENLNFGEKRVIFGDLHMRNVIVDNGYYFIDFDNVYIGEIEEDLGKMLLNFCSWRMGRRELKKFSKLLKEIKEEYSIEKIVLYAIYELFWVLNESTDAVKRNHAVWFIDWIYRNKDIIVNVLKAFIGES